MCLDEIYKVFKHDVCKRAVSKSDLSVIFRYVYNCMDTDRHLVVMWSSLESTLNYPGKPVLSTLNNPGKPVLSTLNYPGKPVLSTLNYLGKPVSSTLNYPGKPVSSTLNYPVKPVSSTF